MIYYKCSELCQIQLKVRGVPVLAVIDITIGERPMLYLYLVLAFLAALLVAYWVFIASGKVIPPNMVGIRLHRGKPEERVYQPGWAFVPYIPIQWNGYHWQDMVLIPTRIFKLTYEGKEDHKLRSQDRQLLFLQFTMYLQFPYDCAKYLIDMIRTGVPFGSEAKLTEWVEDKIVPILLQVLKRRGYRKAISEDEMNAINDEVNAILKQEGSVLRLAGIYGEDPKVKEPGTGFADLEVEQILCTPELEAAMAAPAVADEMALAARSNAANAAEKTGSQVLGIVARMHGMTLKALERDLRKNPKKAGLSVNDGGYAESFAWAQPQTTRNLAGDQGELSYNEDRIDISSGGKGIDPNFAIVFAGLKAVGAARGGAKQQGQRGGQGGGGNRGGQQRQRGGSGGNQGAQNAADRADDADSD